MDHITDELDASDGGAMPELIAAVTGRRAGDVSSDDVYRLVVESLHEGVVYQGPDAAIRAGNRRAEEILGLTADQMSGRTSLDPRWRAIHPDGTPFPGPEHPVPQVIGTGVAQLDVKMGIHKPDGTLTWLSVSAHPVAKEGAGWSVICTFTDITARHEAEIENERIRAELVRSNEELQRFAYTASHDLREPLRVISGFADLLQRRYGPQLDEDAASFIQHITGGVDRMQELIDALLLLARIGRGDPPAAAVETGAAVTEAVEALSQTIADSGAEVTVDGPLPAVRGDHVQIRQLFQNLIANGLKFGGGDPPRVRISGTTGHDPRGRPVAVLRVRDEGIGIPEADQERIFEIFTRLHARSEIEGTGIGLAICARIVARHRGRIDVDSEPGRGSTFVVTLPVLQGASA